ncbi:MAG: hypothetical protein IKQ92_03110 [Clostridia bacterium]|nr:hypothetical protein [Clostridia bacterium]
MKRKTKNRRKVCGVGRAGLLPLLLVFCLLVFSCGESEHVFYPSGDRTAYREAQKNRNKLPFEPVYTDELVPEGYEPMKDDLILKFENGETPLIYLVNPYSTRTTLLCHDPLCVHESQNGEYPFVFSCPLFRTWTNLPAFFGTDRSFCAAGTEP